MTSEFVISLDFELLWGVRDHADRESYGRNILGGREAIPRILDLFERHGIRATWATVGFLFAEDKDELLASLPPEELRPTYAQDALSNYRYLGEVGQNERQDPYSFGCRSCAGLPTPRARRSGRIPSRITTVSNRGRRRFSSRRI